jgi:hypothetical protein
MLALFCLSLDSFIMCNIALVMNEPFQGDFLNYHRGQKN